MQRGAGGTRVATSAPNIPLSFKVHLAPEPGPGPVGMPFDEGASIRVGLPPLPASTRCAGSRPGEGPPAPAPVPGAPLPGKI